LKLIGSSVWERRGGNGRNVTFPARQYSVNGERRSFALLRPIADASAQAPSLFFCVLVGVYLLVTWRYLNLGAAVAAVMLMLARIPDLLQEMRTGDRTTATNMRKNGIDYVTTVLMWLALPVLCLSFY
jgi:hypothetical protein